MTTPSRRALGLGLLASALVPPAGPVRAAGNLAGGEPVTVEVRLGAPDGRHAFEPSRLRFETGRLYRLVLRNAGRDPHYFTSDDFAARVFTR
jgi:hypothetical protein